MKETGVKKIENEEWHQQTRRANKIYVYHKFRLCVCVCVCVPIVGTIAEQTNKHHSHHRRDMDSRQCFHFYFFSSYSFHSKEIANQNQTTIQTRTGNEKKRTEPS